MFLFEEDTLIDSVNIIIFPMIIIHPSLEDIIRFISRIKSNANFMLVAMFMARNGFLKDSERFADFKLKIDIIMVSATIYLEHIMLIMVLIVNKPN